jgi:Lon protease-like protein
VPEEPTELPMFPLGSVLLPGMLLPLRVFEPRYRVLVDTVLLADEPEFGCVLIERGSEVGGGDVRATVGCVARIVELARHDDGQVSLVSVGVRRLRVEEWLPDDPFPRALVRDWPDDRPAGEDDDEDDRERIRCGVARVDAAVRELADLAAEMGLAPTLDEAAFSDDPSLRIFQLATVSPLGAHDRLRVLRCPGLAGRVELLEDLVAEQRIMLEARRGFDSD